MESTAGKPIEWNNIRLVPVLHNRMEFALEVRRQFEEFKPDCVAVEYPDTLADKILQGIKRLPLLSVVYYEEKDGAFTYLVLEPTDAQVEAVRLALSESVPVHFIDRDTEGYTRGLSHMPDAYAVTRIGLLMYYRAYLAVHGSDSSSREDALREMTMAYHLQCLSSEGKRVLFVGGIAHFPGLLSLLDRPQTSVIGRRKRQGVGLAHLHRDSSREIMTEMPFLAAVYERARSARGSEDPDRLKINSELIKIAGENLFKNSKEELSPNDLKVLNKFARNYTLLTGDLVPSFYQLLVAARGAKDDNFAYEVWEKGSEYPWQSEAPGLPVLRLTGEDLFLDQKRIRFHRRLKTMRRRLIPVPVKKRMREKYPGDWKRDFKGHSICSYPPEDVVIEGYGRNLRKRALEIKTEENARVEPFACSMLDGIDIRETIRDWTSGKIYVKAERPFRGKVGSLVVIFDPDVTDKDGQENFPWCVTWLGEHDQESDMAFYSTPAGEVMDGPGISRCQYGGFMLTYPPMRVYDIWKDPVFNMAGNKSERLLMAAIDYSLEKHVLYVSATPPSGWCQNMAARLGKKIIYLPIGIFSPVTLKKIRQVHILDGHHVRRYARHFI
ncbi:MAG: hypothetical protein U9N82_07280 [Thermodesulfobacteriota bacterium]|nr:hypothetical protein [Thermodesulfobacteriota bacterium]